MTHQRGARPQISLGLKIHRAARSPSQPVPPAVDPWDASRIACRGGLLLHCGDTLQAIAERRK
jgi:hypothetical protein